ncbi:MAG: DUF1648 domain-containing protein [Clostridium sp.]|nr:DUF1648 domain-containing protein [Clostridium sp.]MDU7083750.1 DUF1648 domain-containing protein [Clostridium sp.]
MKNKILGITTFLPLVVTFIVINFLPERIPRHYDLQGNIDAWGSRNTLFIFPVVIILITLIWLLVIKYFEKKSISAEEDKERKEAGGNAKVLYVVAIVENLVFNVMCYSFIFSAYLEVKSNAQVMAIDINTVMGVVYGLMFIVLGNVMSKCKRNSVLGLRTPWSMKNDIAWAKSQRWGGISFIVSGIIIIVSAFIYGGLTVIGIMLGVLTLDAVLCFPLSYIAWKKSEERGEA